MNILDEISERSLPLPFLKNGVAQIAFIVEDLRSTVEKYYKYFGIGPWNIYTYGKPLVKRMSLYGRETEYKMKVGLSYFGDMRVELIQPLEGDTLYSKFVEEHGYGIQHLGFLVDDMEKAIKIAERAGFRMVMDGSGFGLDGDGHYAYLDTEDIIGITIELIERPKRRYPPEEIYPSPE